MKASQEFLNTHGSRFSDQDKTKAINRLEVRMVMHIHGKTAATRASFNSFVNIVVEFYKEIKALDSMLPVWSKLPKITADDKQSKKKAVLRETGGGSVGEDILAEEGFSFQQSVM